MKPALNAFEEFELKPNIFDLLELRTIDDKAALEQILANATPPLSKSVVESSIQSSSDYCLHHRFQIWSVVAPFIYP